MSDEKQNDKSKEKIDKAIDSSGEITRSMTEEDFVNTLLKQREKRQDAVSQQAVSQQEVEELLKRLGLLQQKLATLKQDVKKEKVFAEVKLTNEIVLGVKEVMDGLSINPACTEKREKGYDILGKALDFYDSLLEDELKSK